MNKICLALLAAAVIPLHAFGQSPDSYRCTYGDLQRRVEILREAGVAVPCEVHYHKDTEAPGERQVLWSAASEAGYCERKTEAFIAQLEGWGWDCGQDAESQAAPEGPDDTAAAPEVADDTEALTSAEETEADDVE